MIQDLSLHGVGKTKVQTSCYSRKEEENLNGATVRLSKQVKTAASQSLSPKQRSMLQAIKRIHYQVFYWSRIDEAIISDIISQDNGWIVDSENDEARPLWLTSTLSVSFLHFHSGR